MRQYCTQSLLHLLMWLLMAPFKISLLCEVTVHRARRAEQLRQDPKQDCLKASPSDQLMESAPLTRSAGMWTSPIAHVSQRTS